MNNLDELKMQILQMFAQTLNIEVPSPDLDLIDGGFLDSLVFVDLIMTLQQQYQIEISVAELEFDEFRSVNRIAEYINQRTSPETTATQTAQQETMPTEPTTTASIASQKVTTA